MQRKRVIYEIIMMVLSLIVIAIVIVQLTLAIPSDINNILSNIDFVIWIVFISDYIIRLFRATDKKYFVLQNKIDLITILPFNSLFRALRVFKIARPLKLLKFTRGLLFLSRFTNKLKIFVKTNNFNYTLIATVTTIFIGAGLISIAENMSFEDAVWWSFVTATTVGYGDISPSTNIGRVIACILMLVGIGFIGMLTGTISTYFLTKRNKGLSYKEEVIEDIKHRLDNIDNMSIEDIDSIGCILKALKQDNE